MRIQIILLCGIVASMLHLSTSQAQTTAPSAPPLIDISKAPAPQFDDPDFHGATDPAVIWVPAKKQWFMYYTQRRATMPNPNGVTWVHGSKIGIATSPDGVTWTYAGTAKGDQGLTDPLSAKGFGIEPGITWWAPGFVYENHLIHMYVTRVDGIYRAWGDKPGNRNIVHFTSEDGVNFKYISTAKLSSDRVIDAAVYKVADTWYMVYKDEAAGSRTTRSESKDMDNWTNHKIVSPDGSQEAPWVFQWKGKWWLIVDGLGNRGLRMYSSENGIEGWQHVTTVLADSAGTRTKDNNVGHHPGIIVQGEGDKQQCLVYYFTHQRNLTVMQVAEIEMGADGKPFVNRNKYAPSTQPMSN